MNNHMSLRLVGANSSLELNSPTTSIYLQEELEGLSTLPAIRETKGMNIGMDGGWTSAQFYEPRLVTIKGVIANKDVSVVELRRRQLIQILSEKKLRLEFRTEAGNLYELDVVVAGLTMPINKILTSSYFKISLRADDPLIYDNTSSTGREAILNRSTNASSGFPINFPINFQLGDYESRPTINNFGTSTVYPVITVTGELTNPEIVNITTNEYFKINTTISSGSVAVIDTQAHTIVIDGVTSYSDIADGSSWIHLQPGNNEFFLTSDENADTGYATISYRVGYMGV